MVAYFHNLILSNLWKTAKAMLKKNFLALNAYMGKEAC